MNFYKCSICGNVIELIDGDINRMTCCGQKMDHLVAHTEDEGYEKHIPAYTVEDGKLRVQIGDVLHPMLEKHYIMFIAVVKGDKITRIDLKPNEDPVAYFEYEEGSTIYEYCNIHGLWKKDL